MTTALIIILIGAAIVAIAVFLNSRRAKESNQPGDEETVILTPKGVEVISAYPIDTDLLIKIDADLDRLFDIARRKGYSNFSTHQDYRIEIVETDPRCADGISFSIIKAVSPGTNYDGTDYDKDPRPGFIAICAAGEFDPKTLTIRVTLPGIATSDIVRYEGEHRLLFEADRQLYEVTKYHGEGPGHPILGD